MQCLEDKLYEIRKSKGEHLEECRNGYFGTMGDIKMYIKNMADKLKYDLIHLRNIQLLVFGSLTKVDQ